MLSKTVYSLVYPETSDVLRELWQEQPHQMYLSPHLQGQLKIDEKFKNTWLQWVSSQVKMPEFNYFYPTAGSSEAIRESISLAKVRNPKVKIHVFNGEYEGYKAYADAYGIEIVSHERGDYKTEKFQRALNSEDLFYLSNPSSIDGNIWQGFDEFISILNNSKLKLMLDLCYVGATAKEMNLDLNQPCIHTIFFSLSKVFGVYYHRIGGVFSREEMPALYGNIWFKNLFSLCFGTKLMENIKIGQLPKKYAKLQKEICEKENLSPADVVLLGIKESEDVTDPLYRHKLIRACLTPKMEQIIYETTS